MNLLMLCDLKGAVVSYALENEGVAGERLRAVRAGEGGPYAWQLTTGEDDRLCAFWLADGTSVGPFDWARSWECCEPQPEHLAILAGHAASGIGPRITVLINGRRYRGEYVGRAHAPVLIGVSS